MRRNHAAEHVSEAFEVGARHCLGVGEFVNYGFLIERLEELCGAFGVGVADKNLAESVVVNHANQAFYPLCVELVEHVVEQQDGLSAERLMKHFKRGEFEGNQETFLLAL